MGIIKGKKIVGLFLAVCVCLAMVPWQTEAASKGSRGFSGKSVNSATASKLIRVAKSKRGCPYSYGAAGPRRFDCSGFVAYCMKKSGIKFRRGTAASYNKRGYRVGRSIRKAQKGDILLYSAGGRISHCGIYAGKGKVIHASYSRGIRLQGYRIPGLRLAGVIRTFNKPDTGVALKVTDSSRKVAGTKYKIVGKKYSKVVKVNKKGYVKVTGLKAGAYKVIPMSLNKDYRAKFTKNIKVKKGKIVNVKFINAFKKTKALIAAKKAAAKKAAAKAAAAKKAAAEKAAAEKAAAEKAAAEAAAQQQAQTGSENDQEDQDNQDNQPTDGQETTDQP